MTKIDEEEGEEEVEDDLEWEEWNPSQITFLNHMIAGSFAGLAEHVSIFPIDTLKTHIQCQKCGSMSPMQTFSCAQGLVQREGIFRLWRGVTATFAGCLPGRHTFMLVIKNIIDLTVSVSPLCLQRTLPILVYLRAQKYYSVQIQTR
jgi:hypothetical protein